MSLARIETTAPTTIEFHGLSDVVEFANIVVNTSMVPAAMRGKPDEVTVALIAGMELGLKPVQALRSINVIQGTPVLKPEAMRAIVQAAGHVCDVVESTDERAAVRVQRRGGAEHVVTFTIVEAQRAGLSTKDNWKKNPADMLVARVTGRACRRYFSDLINGFYAEGELAEEGAGIAVDTRKPAAVETPYISAENAERIRVACTERGVDVARVVSEATNGRTDDVAQVRKDEVAAVRGALDLLAKEAERAPADPETGEVAGVPIGAKAGAALHRDLAGKHGLDAKWHGHVIANVTKGRTTHAAEVWSDEVWLIREGAEALARKSEEDRQRWADELAAKAPELFGER
jgi:hypothetical protein